MSRSGVLLLVVLTIASLSTLCRANQCCSEGLSLVRGGCLVHGLTPRNVSEPYQIQCDHGMFLLDPSASEMDRFYVDEVTKELVVGDPSKSFREPPERFCIGELSRENIAETTKVAIVCVNDPYEGNLYYVVKGTCVVISVVFLVLTAMCYILLPELRDLQGKCMLCAVISLAIGFLSLGIAQLGLVDHDNHESCMIISMMIFIWMLAYFFWLNVVAFNIWRSTVGRTRRVEDSNIFRFYSAYAWGCPLILAGIVLILQYGPTDIKMLGHHRCFISHEWSFMMFYLIIGIILISNIIMYCVTSWKLWRGMGNLVDDRIRSLKYKCCMYLKLFLMSGVLWIFEVLSYGIESSEGWWLLTDIINGLQGVVMFLVLVALRPRAQRALASRGFLCFRMPQRWRLKPDEELLNDDDDEFAHDETTRTINVSQQNGL